MAKKRVAILFGGVSSEHEVSRVSAASIIKNVSGEKYEVLSVGITKHGSWFLYTGDVENIADGVWEENAENKRVFLTPDPEVGGFLVQEATGVSRLPVDVVIPVLHGKNGEDGTIQGMLTLSGIPFVGCDMISSAMCMDKVVTNIMLEAAGIAQARFAWVLAFDFFKNREASLASLEKKIKTYPVFVKPANAGSSVGVSKAENREELARAIEIAAKEDDKILVEEGICGQEVECAVLGNHELVASIVGEIDVSEGFYDYDTKYKNNNAKLHIPAKISEEAAAEVQRIAKQAYKVMGCSGLSRIDFFVERGTQRILLNEINTFPGFTAISMYPSLMAEVGYPLGALIDKLITLALERNRKIDG